MDMEIVEHLVAVVEYLTKQNRQLRRELYEAKKGQIEGQIREVKADILADSGLPTLTLTPQNEVVRPSDAEHPRKPKRAIKVKKEKATAKPKIDLVALSEKIAESPIPDAEKAFREMIASQDDAAKRVRFDTLVKLHQQGCC